MTYRNLVDAGTLVPQIDRECAGYSIDREFAGFPHARS
jgi:hypothetical protein